MGNRYQKEIEEILKKSGGPARPPRRSGGGLSFWRMAWLLLRRSLGGKMLSISPGRVMLVSGSLLLSALIFRAVFPGIVAPLAWAGLLLFIVGYGMFFVRPQNKEKRWRGQVIEGSGESWWDRLRRRLR